MTFFAHIFFAEAPPAEPPVFEIPPAVSVLENEPIPINIAASQPGASDTEGLVVYVDNAPMGATFSSGTREGDRWIFTPEEFGQVELTLPPDYAGSIDLEITAVASTGASRHRSLIVDVQRPTTEPVETLATVRPTIALTTEEETPSNGTDMTRVTPKTDVDTEGTDGGTKDGGFCIFNYNMFLLLLSFHTAADDPGIDLYIIIAAAVGGLFIIVTMTLCCICLVLVRRQSRHKDKHQYQDFQESPQETPNPAFDPEGEPEKVEEALNSVTNIDNATEAGKDDDTTKTWI